MSFVIGYRGEPYFTSLVSGLPMQPPPAPGHPLASQPSKQVTLTTDEILPYLDGTGLDWNKLDFQQQKTLAIVILSNRGTENALQQADALSLNIAAFNGPIQVDQSPDTQEQPSIADYLLN
jgi:hypothetical protein